MLQLRTQYLSDLRQTLIYRKTIDHSSNSVVEILVDIYV